MQQLLSIQNGDNADLTNVNHFQTCYNYKLQQQKCTFLIMLKLYNVKRNNFHW